MAAFVDSAGAAQRAYTSQCLIVAVKTKGSASDVRRDCWRAAAVYSLLARVIGAENSTGGTAEAAGAAPGWRHNK